MEVILFCAITVDGRIARSDKDPVDWTGREDKKYFAVETKKAGVVIMGRKTFETLDRPLPGRLNIVMTHNSGSYKCIPGLLEFNSSSPKEILAMLRKREFKRIFVVGGSEVNGLFLRSGLIDEIWLTICPLVFGNGMGLFSGVSVSIPLELLELIKLSDGSVVIKYRVSGD